SDLSNEPDREQENLPADAAAATLGAALGLAVGPVGSILGAAAGPFIARGLKVVRTSIKGARENKEAFLILQAADYSGLSPEALVARLQEHDDRGELLLRALRAAQDAGSLEKLLALA